MKCPKCGKGLIGYTNGESYGFGAGYPYESGYYCPDRCVSFSDLEISRGVLAVFQWENIMKDILVIMYEAVSKCFLWFVVGLIVLLMLIYITGCASLPKLPIVLIEQEKNTIQTNKYRYISEIAESFYLEKEALILYTAICEYYPKIDDRKPYTIIAKAIKNCYDNWAEGKFIDYCYKNMELEGMSKWVSRGVIDNVRNSYKLKLTEGGKNGKK